MAAIRCPSKIAAFRTGSLQGRPAQILVIDAGRRSVRIQVARAEADGPFEIPRRGVVAFAMEVNQTRKEEAGTLLGILACRMFGAGQLHLPRPEIQSLVLPLNQA